MTVLLWTLSLITYKAVTVVFLFQVCFLYKSFCSSFQISEFVGSDEVQAYRCLISLRFFSKLNSLSRVVWPSLKSIVSAPQMPESSESASATVQEARAPRKRLSWTGASRQHSSTSSWVVRTLSSLEVVPPLPWLTPQQGTSPNSPHPLRKIYFLYLIQHESEWRTAASSYFFVLSSTPMAAFSEDLESQWPHNNMLHLAHSLHDNKDITDDHMLTVSIGQLFPCRDSNSPITYDICTIHQGQETITHWHTNSFTSSPEYWNQLKDWTHTPLRTARAKHLRQAANKQSHACAGKTAITTMTTNWIFWAKPHK